MNKIRVGMVGAGLVSDSHARGYLEHNDAEIMAVCDVNRDLAERKAQLWGVGKTYTDFEVMLADPDLNAVDIVTPPYLHHKMVMKAAEAGKHVNCEKPFCTSGKEGKEMTECAAANGVVLAVDESYLFTASHMKARELIEEGAIGEPVQIRQHHGSWKEREGNPIAQRRSGESGRGGAEWRSDPVKSGGGAYPWLFDHGVHLFALGRYFALDTDVELVSSMPASSAGRGDVPIITWQFEGEQKTGVWKHGGEGSGGYGYRFGFSSVIVGTEGMIEVLGEGGGNLRHEGKPVHLILWGKSGEVEAMRFDEQGEDRIWDSEISYYDQAHVNQVFHFIECVRDGRIPRYGGEDGTREVKATLAAIRSAAEERPIRVSEIPDEFTAY